MIARVWKGWTKAENGDAYEKLLREFVYPGLQKPVAHYGDFLGAEKVDIGVENAYWWDIKTE